MNKDVRRLANHFTKGTHLWQRGERVRLRKTSTTGTIIDILFKKDRTYPYLKIKWDTPVAEEKKFYDPFDITEGDTSYKKKKRSTFNYLGARHDL